MHDRELLRLTLLDGDRPLYLRRSSIVAFNRNQDDSATLVSTARHDYAVNETVHDIFGLLLGD
jgi:hypothetical protein